MHPLDQSQASGAFKRVLLKQDPVTPTVYEIQRQKMNTPGGQAATPLLLLSPAVCASLLLCTPLLLSAAPHPPPSPPPPGDPLYHKWADRDDEEEGPCAAPSIAKLIEMLFDVHEPSLNLP